MCKKIIWTLAFVFSFMFNQIASAATGHCGQGLREMVQSIKLSDEQKSKISPILEQLKSTVATVGPQMRDVTNQIKQQVYSANMDQNTVNGLVDKKTKLLGEIMKAKLTAKNQILAILTPEQKTELQGLFKKVEEKIEEQYKQCHDQD